MTRPNQPFASVLDAIGDTPLVELARLTRRINGRILAKLDYLNPGFSKKDRIARQMIQEAEAEGRLRPGQTVVELTSGNTGTGLVIVCTVKGYPFVAVMSQGNSVVEPAGAAVLAGEAATYPNHRIQGGGYAVADLPLLRPDHIDGYVQVTDEAAIHTARRLAREEGIFAGFSAGANVAAALQLLQSSLAGKTVAVILPDSGLKYLSTDLWELP